MYLHQKWAKDERVPLKFYQAAAAERDDKYSFDGVNINFSLNRRLDIFDNPKLNRLSQSQSTNC